MSFSTLDISEFVLIVLFVISVVHHAHIAITYTLPKVPDWNSELQAAGFILVLE